MAANPMYQFNVYRIGPEIKLGEVDISFTNASLFMVISSLAILIIFNLGAKKKTLIPGVTHVDGTGRLQTVNFNNNPRYYNLIKEFF